MGYPLDVAAQNAALDGLLGDAHASTVPASFEVAFFNAHPLLGGTELTSAGGYVRPTVANDSGAFPDAVDGVKVSAQIPIADPSGAWSDTATHLVLIDGADSTTRWFVGKLRDELAIDGSETNVAASAAIFWNTEGL